MENVSAAIGTGMIASTDARKLVFVYDYRGRRVEKKVYGGWNGSAYTGSALSDTRYLYDGWNLVAELNSTGSTVTRSYTWGLDVTGDLDAAGGVGGLLQIHGYANAGPGGSSGNTYWPTYDGNGNVAALYNSVSSGAFAVAYEYDPYGNFLRADMPTSDTVMADNAIRFSSKFTDLESGLVYYGNRYYNPKLGRFVNRDPIEESGSVNLYAFCGNNGIDRSDILGNNSIPLVGEAADGHLSGFTSSGGGNASNGIGWAMSTGLGVRMGDDMDMLSAQMGGAVWNFANQLVSLGTNGDKMSKEPIQRRHVLTLDRSGPLEQIEDRGGFNSRAFATM
ncbi:MAG TPA: RHS repeat-associated core domain-containing protein [Candidatus Didemnitutus sp.]|jgi:RHS repeat-associated protein